MCTPWDAPIARGGVLHTPLHRGLVSDSAAHTRAPLQGCCHLSRTTCDQHGNTTPPVLPDRAPEVQESQAQEPQESKSATLDAGKHSPPALVKSLSQKVTKLAGLWNMDSFETMQAVLDVLQDTPLPLVRLSAQPLPACLAGRLMASAAVDLHVTIFVRVLKQLLC